jgi:hypothetical protein
MRQTTKVSARLDEKSVAQIKAELEIFGCKTVTRFVQQAVTEKLERYTIGKLIEESIGKQNTLNSKLESVLKSVLMQEKNAAEVVNQIAVSLAKISTGFNELNKKN